jgi:hypothetical protein
MARHIDYSHPNTPTIEEPGGEGIHGLPSEGYVRGLNPLPARKRELLEAWAAHRPGGGSLTSARRSCGGMTRFVEKARGNRHRVGAL